MNREVHTRRRNLVPLPFPDRRGAPPPVLQRPVVSLATRERRLSRFVAGVVVGLVVGLLLGGVL